MLCARAHHERIDERGHGLRELLLEEQTGQRILELETQTQLGATAVLADGRQHPLAFQRAERPTHELHGDALVGVEPVAGREFPVQRTLANPDGRHYFTLRARHDLRVRAPGEEAGVALDIVDDLEDSRRRLGDDR